MSKPVLSLDVSKGFSYAASYLRSEEPFGKPVSVPHTPQGLEFLLNQLANLEHLTGKKPEVILEATGNYSKPLTYSLQQAGYQVIILNPIQTHQQKRRSIRKVKTDPVDAKRIADLYYLQRFNPQPVQCDHIADLKNLCRYYHGLNNLFTEAQLRYQSALDLSFPGYQKVFSRLCCDSALNLIAAYPSPDAVLAAEKEDILLLLREKFQRKNWGEEIYNKLAVAARACLPFKVAQQSSDWVLKEYVHILMTQKKILTDARAQLLAAAKLVPIYDLLLTIPGVGEIRGSNYS